jgi:secreted trypsin-like serine protease
VTKHKDIALVRIYPVIYEEKDRHLPWMDIIKHAKLPGHKHKVKPHDRVTVAGWGVTRTDPNSTREVPSESLRYVALEVVGMEKCKSMHEKPLPKLPKDEGKNKSPEYLPFRVDEWNICAGWNRGGRGICRGDLGSPLFDSKRVLVGVVSWALMAECGRADRPGVFANVARHRNFIDEYEKRTWNFLPDNQ